jgi:hypothetical protein
MKNSEANVQVFGPSSQCAGDESWVTPFSFSRHPDTDTADTVQLAN